MAVAATTGAIAIVSASTLKYSGGSTLLLITIETYLEAPSGRPMWSPGHFASRHFAFFAVPPRTLSRHGREINVMALIDDAVVGLGLISVPIPAEPPKDG